ncbi:CHAT domain-containing protein [Endothiovibrio diazotrophicus]
MVGFKRWWVGLLVALAVAVGAGAEEVTEEPLVSWVIQQFKGDGVETPTDEAVAEGLNWLAMVVHRKGDYRLLEQAALAAYRYCLTRLGETHQQTLIALNSLEFAINAQGRYGEAELLYRRALEVRERVLGEEHPDTLVSANNLAFLYQRQGRYGEAEPLYRWALAVRVRVLGKEHPDTLVSINNLAGLYESQGRYGEAETLYRGVLEVSERVLGKEHPNTLVNVNNLAGLYELQGRYGEAEPLFRRALEVRERVLGKEHPQTLGSVNNLAGLYESQGRYGEAEPLYRRALEVSERVLGKEHPDTLVNVNNLAALYESQGRHEEAEPLYRRALEVRERVLGKEHPQTLGSVNNLAALYQRQGRYGEAEPLCRRALTVLERVLGEEHPDTLGSVNNLAALYESQGRYGEAEPLYRRALEVRERVLGEEHPDTLVSANNLAFLYQRQGRYGEAEPLYRRGLEAHERVLGEAHPDTLSTQLNWIVLLINQEKIPSAVRQLRRMDARLRRFVSLQLTTTQQERVRLSILTAETRFQDVVFSLALRHPGTETRRLAADVLLRWKQLAGEQEARLARLVRTSRDERVVRLAKAVAARRGALAQLVNLETPKPEAVTTARAELERAEAELNALGSELVGDLAERSVEWEGVQERLPGGSALLELRRYQPVDLRTGEPGELHWLALLLPASPGDGPELWIEDLGPVEASAAPQALLSRTGSDEAAADLYRTLFAKLDQRLATYDPLYVAPDGPLELAPLARLRLADGRYWAERQSLRRLRTGRDLLPSHRGRTGEGMVAYGGVDYGAYPETKGATTPGTAAAGTQTPLLAANQRLRDERGAFSTLAHTRAEAEEVARYFWDHYRHQPQVFRDREATESRLKGLSAPPKVLHLATHGFFLNQNRERTERPATLSGVALAGANLGMAGKRSAAGEDGILYALEAQDLNLEGTELVTLSACDTGKGRVDYTEGVFGLTRAFHIAGARNVMMTLWPIDDALGREFMAEFYRRWFEDPDQPPADALRATRLAWIKSDDPQRRDPRHWAPYVLVERR